MLKNRYATDELFLIDALNKGDESAYRFLFDRYYNRLVFFANKLLQDLDSSRNTVQDVFVMLFERKDEITIHTNLNGFLHQMVKNRALNILKHEKVKLNHHNEILSISKIDDTDDVVEFNELQETIINIVNNLAPQCKNIFQLSRIKGKSNQEIADELDISKRTVETQISNALKELRKELKKLELLPFILFFITKSLF